MTPSIQNLMKKLGLNHLQVQWNLSNTDTLGTKIIVLHDPSDEDYRFM